MTNEQTKPKRSFKDLQDLAKGLPLEKPSDKLKNSNDNISSNDIGMPKDKSVKKDSKKANKTQTKSKVSSKVEGLEIHIFNEKNVMDFFFSKTNNRAKKYELFWFFKNNKDLRLSEKIDTLINKWIEEGILKRVPRDNWFYPNIDEKEKEIIAIRKGENNK